MRSLKRLAALAAIPAASLAMTTTAATAHASVSRPAVAAVQASPRFTCPTGSGYGIICEFQGDYENGTYEEVFTGSGSGYYNANVPFQVANFSPPAGGQNAGSATNHVGHDLWFGDRQDGLAICVDVGNQVYLDHKYGWSEWDWNNNCSTDSMPPGLLG